MPEHRALAGAAGSQQRHHFAALDIEIDTIQYTPAAIGDRQIADADDRTRHDLLHTRHIEDGGNE